MRRRKCIAMSGTARRSSSGVGAAGETDQLLAQRLGGGEGLAPLWSPLLARVGELRSAALMAFLCGWGSGACALDPYEMRLEAEGDPLDSDLALDAPRCSAG